VKVARRHHDQETVLDYVGPGGCFGEIGLLSGLSDEVAALLPRSFDRGRRTTTCTALDHVELVCIRGADLEELLRQDGTLRAGMTDVCRRILRRYAVEQERVEQPLESYLEQGLYHARSLLVLDLTRCTRCDECTKACADSHQGVTRLLREGLRLDRYLVATSCRSCLDPVCMIGCPVDAIHRENGREVQIRDWCVGCELCSRSCPYGNIHMAKVPVERDDPDRPGRTKAVLEQKATTCDLCESVVPRSGDPSCVYACPHDAAFRMNGRELWKRVERGDRPG
jgi:Fe-S-cluster-containing dehydrogenase component